LTKSERCAIIIIENKKGGSNMARFIIVDFYNYPEDIIGRTDSEEEADRIKEKRYDDTDDKADVIIYDMEKTRDYFFARDYGFLNSD